ncbi:hypothetical protein ACX80O_09585 [Arthrobacter sp. Hz1]
MSQEMGAGLTVGLTTAAIAVSIVIAPQAVVTVLLVAAVLGYAATVVLFGHAWSRGSHQPWAVWVSTGSLGLAGLLVVTSMASFGQGIAVANNGEPSSMIDTLLLVSTVGVPVFAIVDPFRVADLAPSGSVSGATYLGRRGDS